MVSNGRKNFRLIKNEWGELKGGTFYLDIGFWNVQMMFWLIRNLCPGRKEMMCGESNYCFLVYWKMKVLFFSFCPNPQDWSSCQYVQKGLCWFWTPADSYCHWFSTLALQGSWSVWLSHYLVTYLLQCQLSRSIVVELFTNVLSVEPISCKCMNDSSMSSVVKVYQAFYGIRLYNGGFGFS